MAKKKPPKQQNGAFSPAQFSRQMAKTLNITPLDDSPGSILDFRNSIRLTFKSSLEIALKPENAEKCLNNKNGAVSSEFSRKMSKIFNI